MDWISKYVAPYCVARSKLNQSIARLHLKHDGISTKTRWHFVTSTSYDVFQSRRRGDAINFSPVRQRSAELTVMCQSPHGRACRLPTLLTKQARHGSTRE